MWPIARGQIAGLAAALVGGGTNISAVNSLYAVGDTTNNAAFATTSLTPTPNSLLIVVVAAERAASTDPGAVTITDTALLTWVAITGGDYQYLSSGVTRARIAAYAAKAPASGSTVITATYAAGATSGAVLEVFEVIGSDVANGVSQTVNVQTPVLQTPNQTGTSLSLTLAAAANSKNRPFCVVAHTAAEGTSPGSNWTEIGDANHASPGNSLETQWRSDAFDTAVAASWSTSTNFGAIAFEIKSS